MLTVVMLHGDLAPEDLGELPGMLDEDDPRPAREQLHEGYRHGGGWRPMQSGIVKLGKGGRLEFPDDPPLIPLAVMKVRQEIIMLFEHDFVGILQADGSIEVCRMD